MTKRKGSLRLDGDAWFLRVYIAGRQRSFHLGHRRDFVSEDEVHAAADIVCFTALNEAYL
jgi:hypothetical protein